jgi:hypothetical protein
VANGTLSSYFEKEKAKGTKAGGASPYSAPADAGGSAPSGGGPSAPSAPSAPKGSAGGGTGFVSFGQYFGANAPAIQQQAQQTTTGKTRTELGVLQQPGGYDGGSAFDQMLAGGVVQREATAKQSQLDAQAASQAAARQKYLDEMAAQQRASNQAVQQQYDTRQQYMAEEPPESRKSRSRPAGSRFDGYFNE